MDSKVKELLKNWINSKKDSFFPKSDIYYFYSNTQSEKCILFFENKIQLFSLKDWFTYLEDLSKQGNYIQTLYWINELVQDKPIRFSRISSPFVLKPNEEKFILGLVQMFIGDNLTQDNIDFLLEIVIQILIKMKKFDFLFNDFLMKLRTKEQNENTLQLFKVFLCFLASFIRQVNC